MKTTRTDLSALSYQKVETGSFEIKRQSGEKTALPSSSLRAVSRRYDKEREAWMTTYVINPQRKLTENLVERINKQSRGTDSLNPATAVKTRNDRK